MAQPQLPCQDIDFSVEYLDEDGGTFMTLNEGDTIQTCFFVELNTTPLFPQNDSIYHQSVGTSTFSWILLNPLGGLDSTVFNTLDPVIEVIDNHVYTTQFVFTDSNSCTDTFTFFLENPNPNTEVTLSVDDSVLCEGNTSIVHVFYTNPGDILYTDSAWSSSPGSGVFTSLLDLHSRHRSITGILNPANSDIMTITYSLEDEFGCVWEDEIDVQVWPNPEADDNDTIICDDTFTIGVDIPSNMPDGTWTVTVPPGLIGQVQFIPNNTVTNPQIKVPALGTYDFIYTTICGTQAVQTLTFASEPPEITVSEDTVYCGFSVDLTETANITDGQWSFTGPSGATVNFADASAFNTEAIVDSFGTYTFTFTYDWCDASFSKDVVFIDQAPKITTTTKELFCEKTMNLSATIEGLEGQWSGFGPGVISFSNFQGLQTSTTVTEFGTYTFFYTGCEGSDSITVDFNQVEPTLEAPEFVQCGIQAILSGNWHGMESGTIATWQILESPEGSTPTLEDNGNIGTKVLTADVSGKYRVQVRACELVDERDIIFFCPLEDIPNVFSPNSDGENDVFFIKGINDVTYSTSEIQIFNRWGTLVYQNKEFGLNGSWWKGENTVGEPLPSDTYFYELVLRNSTTNLDETHKGTINLFR
jgi:gliding motility-associated-like protein